MGAFRGFLSVAIFVVCCNSIGASPFIGQFVDFFKNTGNALLEGFGEAIKPWNRFFESGEKYVQRYLAESINNLQEKADAIATIQGNANKLREYIVDTRKNATILAKVTNQSLNLNFGNLDLALKIASRKSSDCVKKGNEKKNKLFISFNNRLNAAFRTLDKFSEIESDIDEINVRLAKSKNINSSIAAMQACAKNVNINMFNAPNVANCIAQIGIAFFGFFTDNSGGVETRLVNVQKRTQNVVADFNASFKDILSDAENQTKQAANEILACAGVTINTSDYLNDILKDIKEKETRTETSFARLALVLVNLRLSANGYLTKVEKNIDKAVEPLFVAIAATLKKLPKVDLSKEQEKLKKLIEEGKYRTNITILFEIIDGLKSFNIDLQAIIDLFRKSVTQLTLNYFETQCKRGIVLDLEFRLCVEDIYQRFLDLFNVSVNGITGINGKLENITLKYNAYINIKFDLQIIFNWSNEAGNTVYANNQIIGEDLLDYAIKVNSYNVTPILETIFKVNFIVNELDKKNTISLYNGNSTIFASGGAIYDIGGPGRLYCNQKTIDEKLKNAQALVAERTIYVLSKAPVLSPTIAELFQQAATVNSTLYEQIAKLDPERLKIVCPLSSTQSLFLSYQCIVNEVNKFGAYYQAEIEKIKNYVNDAQTKLDSATVALNDWRIQFVLPEAEAIKQKLKLESESFYVQCNITIANLINYALSVAQSHYANFQLRITTAYSEVIALADNVLSKDYSGYSITARLEAATDPLTVAINAVLASANRSVITAEVYQAKTNLFNEAKIKFDKVLANFSIIAKLYKQAAIDLLQKREDIQKNLNYSILYSACYNPSSPTPLTDLINCALGQVYSRVFVEANNKTLSLLLAMKLVLVRFDTNATGVIQEAADIIVLEYSINIYFSAYTLYKLAGLTVPANVLAQVEGNKCIQGVTTNKYYCVITT